MAHDVFISYASEDKTVAEAICASVEASRVRCWIAPRDILPGMEYPEAIAEAISNSQITVLVYSEYANQSPHILREIERSVSNGSIIIPFRIEDAPFSKSLEYLISTCHWLDALTPPLEDHIARLVHTVGLLLSRVAASHPWSKADNLAIEDEIRAADPNDIAFKEVVLRLSDTWDAFRSWLSTELGDVNIESISEDDNAAEPDFHKSGKPGHLSYQIAITVTRRGLRSTHKLDFVHDWLHPLAESFEGTASYVPWDTSLFPPDDKAAIMIPDSIAHCRDCIYWVSFAKIHLPHKRG